MAASEPGERRNMVLVVLAIIVVVILAGFGLKSLLGGHGSAGKKPPKISLLPSTPPPPPPPPKEEKKPEPPKDQKEVKMDQVEKKDQPPADPTLKMEGAAGDGPSMFGAGKVTNEDLSHLGAGGGSGNGLLNPFNNYASAIKAELQRHLARRSELKRRQYRIEVRVWVTEDGHLKHFELRGTTNDGDMDETIRGVLAALPSFSEPPPAKMPQPIRLRIVAGGRA
jgi:protein TonB